MKQIWAAIWRAKDPDAAFDQSEFDRRIPRLMAWLKDLKAKGKLVGCGGGGFSTHAGGLTLILADGPEEAKALSDGTPMNEIGKTDLLLWDVFYAELVVKENAAKLSS